VAYLDLGQVMATGGGHAARYQKPDVRYLQISEGLAGTEQTIEEMKKAAVGPEGAHNAEVRFLAQQIIAGLPHKDYVAQARAVYEFMRKHVEYVLDPRGLEWVQTPWMTLLVTGQGDCDCAATAICALLASLGHGCAFRTVKGDQTRDEFSHVYALAGLRKHGRVYWIPLDPTEHGAGFGQDPPGAERVERRDWVVVPP
jgi:hypothetical protein